MNARALMAAAVAVTLLAGCTGRGDTSSGGNSGKPGTPFDPAAQVAVEKLRTRPSGGSQVDGVVAVLHTAGAGVYPDGSGLDVLDGMSRRQS